MSKSRLYLSLIAIVAMCCQVSAAKSLSAAKVAKLKGEVSHPFSSARQNSSFGVLNTAKPSLAAPLAAGTDPVSSITDAGGWGTLFGPDGTTWFYSQTYTMSEANPYYYSGSTITIYNDYNEEVFQFDVTIPEGVSVNQIAPFGQVTRSFFERNTSSVEVMVYVHRILSPGFATSDIDIYSSTGGKILSYPDAQSAMLLSEGTSVYSMKERLALAYYETVTEGETTKENMRFDILRKSTYSEGPDPVVEHSFTIDYNTIHYSDGSSFFMKYLDGKFYYILSHYEKPYVESYDWMTGDMTYTEDNNYLVEVYDQNFAKVGGIKAPVEMGSAMPTMYAFNIFSANDISLGYFTGDNKLNLVLASYDYVVATDSYTYFIDLYNADGEIIKALNSNVADWMTLGSIPGQDDQMALLKTDANGDSYFEMFDIPSCKVAVNMPAILDGKIISSNLDRVKSADGYKYVIGMGQGDSDSEGNVIASVGWFNKDLTLNHYVHFNLGPNGEMFTPILVSEYLDPYIFDTDDELEYIYIAKIKRTDGSNKIDNVLCIANEDGSIISQYKGNDEIGVYANGSLLNLGTTHPSLFIAYANSSANTFKIDFYDLPFNKFAGGDGTTENPYLVATAGDLLQVHNNQNAHFKQVADIDLINFGEWTPVDLQGGYDGNNHNISNATIRSDKENAGIFGTVTGVDGTNPAYIKNLSVISPIVEGNESNSCIAPVAGYIVATEIDNVHVFAPGIKWYATYASTIGGIAGNATFQSSIKNCSVSDMMVLSDNAYQVGGILGSLGNSTHVSNCSASIYAVTRNNLGGIVGAAGGVSADGSITNCHANVDLTAENTIGGIAGSSSRIKIANCYATGRIVATCPEYKDYNEPFYSAGGIIGALATDWNNSSNIVLENCVAALDDISVDDPNNTEGVYLTLNRVVGSTANDLGMSQYTEKGIKNCYASTSLTINGLASTSADDTSAAGADKALADMDKSFFEGLGFAYGNDATAPWVDAALPYLFFENSAVAAIATITDMTIDEGETESNGIIVLGGPIEDVSIVSLDETIATVTTVSSDDNFVEFDVTGIADGTTTIVATINGTITVRVGVTVRGSLSVNDVVAEKAAIKVVNNTVVAPEAKKLAVYSIAGTCVAQANATSLSISHLAQGIYVAVATDAAGQRTTVKFVKK